MNREQHDSLITLLAALKGATDTGLLDEMATVIHPDIINGFCDASVTLLTGVESLSIMREIKTRTLQP